MDSEITNLIIEEKDKELLKEMQSQEFSVLVEENKRLRSETEEQRKQNKRIIEHLEEQSRQQQMIIDYLREQLAYFQTKLYGAKSEKKPYLHIPDPMQPEFNFFEDSEPQESQTVTVAEEAEKVSVASYERKKRNKTFSADIPVIERIIDIPESKKHCECGYELKIIGYETSDHLEYFKSRKFIIRYKYPKYACRHCEGTASEGERPTVIKAETVDQLIPKSFATASLLAYLLISKFNDSLPLYRLSKMMEREGVRLSRATMSNWILKIVPMLKPITEIFRENLKKSPVIHCDETYFQVNKEPGKAARTNSYMWVMCSGRGSPPTILYNYSPSRAQHVFCDLIKDYRGYLMTDGYAAYNITDKTDSGVIHLCCMAHARRKFSDALKTLSKCGLKQEQINSSIATQAINQIAKLYAVEKEIREKEEAGIPMSAEEIAAIRKEKSKPVLAEMKARLEEWKKVVTPKSKTGEAVNYFLNQYEQLSRYVNDGRLPIDNNLAENNIRPFTLGRKNWLFNDTVKGAEASAIMFSIIRTAIAN